MIPVKLIERTFSRGKQEWRVNAEGNWFVHIWGWGPYGGNTPQWSWMSVEKGKVPRELLDAAD